MNTQKLAALLETVRCGSMSKAAEKLGYTQSGLAYAINSFETELGLPVIIRDQSGIRLSPEGLELLPYFEELVQCDGKVSAQVERILHRGSNVLNIASYPNFADTVLTHLLADFHTAQPDVELNLRIGNSSELAMWCQSGYADFAFGSQLHLAGFQWLSVCRDPELAVLPLDFPTEGMKAFPMEEFKRHPFIMAEYWEEEAELIRAIESFGIVPQFSIQGRDNAPVLGMVEKGVALTVLPKLTLDTYGGKVKTLPLQPACSRELGVNYRLPGERQTASHRFLKYLKEWIKKTEDIG